MISKRKFEDLLHKNIRDDVHAEETPEEGDAVDNGQEGAT